MSEYMMKKYLTREYMMSKDITRECAQQKYSGPAGLNNSLVRNIERARMCMCIVAVLCFVLF
jgi:hypothetical protein